MNKKSFTLTEIVIAIVIIAVIMAFGMPSYQSGIQKSHERDAAAQLQVIHAANMNYRALEGVYLPSGGANDLNYINTSLGLGIVANDLTYTYASPGVNAFTATATWGAITFQIRVNEAPLSPTNPSCSAGVCLLY